MFAFNLSMTRQIHLVTPAPKSGAAWAYFLSSIIHCPLKTS